MLCKMLTKNFYATLPKPVINKVRSKEEMKKLLVSGMLGNTLRVWDYYNLVRDKYNGMVTIRHNEADSKLCKYSVSQSDILKTISEWNVSIDEFYFNESAPDDRLILQGEYTFYKDHILFFSKEKKPMREALMSGKHKHGSDVICLLHKNMNQKSFKEFEDLRWRYKASVIEFSIFDCCVGKNEGCNTVFWEVRNY